MDFTPHPVTGELAPTHGYGFLGLETPGYRSEQEVYREAAARIDSGEGHNSVLGFMGLDEQKLARSVELTSPCTALTINSRTTVAQISFGR